MKSVIFNDPVSTTIIISPKLQKLLYTSIASLISFSFCFHIFTFPISHFSHFRNSSMHSYTFYILLLFRKQYHTNFYVALSNYLTIDTLHMEYLHKKFKIISIILVILQFVFTKYLTHSLPHCLTHSLSHSLNVSLTHSPECFHSKGSVCVFPPSIYSCCFYRHHW